MSGLFGIVVSDKNRPVTEDFQAMAPAMSLWGPDGCGRWQGAGVAWGHQLQIDTPESRGEQQPYLDPAGTGWRIMADARIDNRDELRSNLGMEGPEGRQLTDAELILRAWRQWGEACLHQLVGAFAFVLWHDESRTLFAARDHLGLRPLLYHCAKGRLLLASEVKAILAVDPGGFSIDEDALLARVTRSAGYLRGHSYWKGVLKVEPGHTLHWRDGVCRTQRYWFPEDIAVQKISLATAAEALESTIIQAVRAQLHTVHRVGAHLSGGIDSGAVADIAHEVLGQRGQMLSGAYSWSPPAGSADAEGGAEYPRIASQERKLGLACRFCDLTPEDFLTNFLLDPTVEPTEVTLYENALGPAMASDGVGVILSGWGGDEAASYNGKGLFAEQFWGGRWWELSRAVTRHRWPMIKADIWAGRPRLLRRLERDEVMEKWARSTLDLASAFNAGEVEKFREWQKREPSSKGVKAAMLRGIVGGHLAHRVTDWAASGAAHNVAYRYPLLDRRVVELSLSFPVQCFWHDGTGRAVMKRAFERRLSRELALRSPKRENSRMSRFYRVAARTLSGLNLEEEDPITRYRRQQALVIKFTQES